jgi:hypothetical protein
MYVAGGSQLLYDDLLLTNLMYTLHTCIYFQLKLALSMGDCFNNEQVSTVENSPTLTILQPESPRNQGQNMNIYTNSSPLYHHLIVGL